jgi:tRNA threonylcarbamoyladenosine biosynthesis protein TsaB
LASKYCRIAGVALSGETEEDGEVIEREDREYNIEQIGVAVLILAVDTTTRAGSLAVVRDGSVLREHRGDETRTHAQRLPGDVVRLCEAAGITIRDVDLYAVAAGPGSFTGLRIGIAAVQGLAMAWSRPVVPVSTLEALALSAPRDLPAETGSHGQNLAAASRVAVWMDAQRGQVFAQVFDVDASMGAARPLTPAISVPPSDALRQHGSLLAGAFFVGDGAVKYRDTIAGLIGGTTQIAADVPPLAGAIALLAGREPARALLPHAVVPIYVRRSDAELARERSVAP